MIALILRDIRRGYAGGGATLVVIFFLLTATLFPFAIGPDPALLARVGGGVVREPSVRSGLGRQAVQHCCGEAVEGIEVPG